MSHFQMYSKKMNTNFDNVKVYYTKLKELKHALDSAKKYGNQESRGKL